MSNQLFFLSLADIFSVYPSIFKELITVREKQTLIYLPSDADWQERMYYRLLEVQKRVNEAIDSGVEVDYVVVRKDIHSFNHLAYVLNLSPTISPTISPNGIFQEAKKKCPQIHGKSLKDKSKFWNLTTIALAAKLLAKPPKPVEFENEHEMRKVYSLIYDVFRYKVVLSNALHDIGFYKQFPEHMEDENRVWLMFYELLGRNFKQCFSEEIDLQYKLFRESEVEEIAEHLWDFRKSLAASISRMRIKFNALNLSKLLPIHLQNEKVATAASNTMVTGWINPFLLRDKTSADKFLLECGYILQESENVHGLETDHYRWDNVCPLFISCVPQNKGEFTKSKLVTKHYFIIQDKAFSYGPAVMSRMLEYFQLSGDILQTHISSPRATAYLASLFYSVNRVNNFYVYGAGPNLKEYRRFMEVLGISNIRIFDEVFTSFPLESKRFGYVVGIFANPPNSFSAISDPIDLICSRGGDLSMLEVLTESEISDEGKRRVSLILEEQLLTLQMAMARPQIQFILYQTHSIVSSENQDMVNYAVKLVNETSLTKHKNAFREKKRLEALADAEAANIPAAAMGSPRKRATADEKGKAEAGGASKSEISVEQNVEADNSEDSVLLPDTDEFVCENIPDICINQDNCMIKQSNGCYLSLIKRTKITQLNAKYLIKMAEARGLFATAEKGPTPRVKGIKAQDTNVEQTFPDEYLDNHREVKHINVDHLISRLMRDTNSSLNRVGLSKASNQKHPLKFNFKRRECARYKASLLKVYQLSRKQTNSSRRCSLESLAETCSTAICCLQRKGLRKLPYPLHIQNLII
ncbi:uncharacterized protein LOC118738974 [Rhagoletis pomonella]|uniref:uncharacterized protein LOC118738974 n=1 Tax=Rhagoletis pomonella TaxID=28610 RepID=UPI0017858745|nr:uncharacterized protein LOC118738974 [Rhagoletis pomonella]